MSNISFPSRFLSSLHQAALAAALVASLASCTKKPPAPQEEPRGKSLPVIQNGPWTDPSKRPEERANLVLAEMTDEEKRLLLFGYFGSPQSWSGYEPPKEARWGSAGYVPGIPRLGIPAQWQADAGMGVATQGSSPEKRARTALPSGLLVACSWDPAVAEAGGKMIGSEARADGFNVMLAGSVNLLRDPYNGRNFEYAGEDPWLAGTIVGRKISGIQSNHVISTAKHFAINDQETDRKASNSILDHAAARQSDLLAFEIALERGEPGAIMCAYNKVDGIYSCENPYLLTTVLREDWGYRGFVLSDWGAVHSTIQAANAGLEQQSGWPFDEQPYFQEPLAKAVAEGKVTKARLDEMAHRILRAMFARGLMDDVTREGGTIDLEKNATVSQRAAEEGIVLLQNGQGLLPLGEEISSIAVIGGYADRGVLSGGGSSQVYPEGGNAVPGLPPQTWPGPVVYYPSAPLAEIRALAPEAKVEFHDGSDKGQAASLAGRSDVAIVFATQWTTESIDTDIHLGGGQNELIEAVAKANDKTIVVLETGGPVLTPWAEEVSAVVQAWYPGVRGGRAIARVLFGEVNPSGHLAATFPVDAQQLAHPEPPRAGDVTYTEGELVGYKWFDAQGHVPRFAFGHGLSYTTFVHDSLELTLKDGEVHATVTLSNTGKRAGKDVVQLYASGPFAAKKRLVGYEKIELAPGESKTVTLVVDPRLLATWHESKRRFIIAEGTYAFMTGHSSRDLSAPKSVSLPLRVLPPRPRAPGE